MAVSKACSAICCWKLSPELIRERIVIHMENIKINPESFLDSWWIDIVPALIWKHTNDIIQIHMNCPPIRQNINWYKFPWKYIVRSRPKTPHSYQLFMQVEFVVTFNLMPCMWIYVMTEFHFWIIYPFNICFRMIGSQVVSGDRMIYARFMTHAFFTHMLKKNHTVAPKYTWMLISPQMRYFKLFQVLFLKRKHISLVLPWSLLHSDIRQTRDIPEIVLCTYTYGAFPRVWLDGCFLLEPCTAGKV